MRTSSKSNQNCIIKTWLNVRSFYTGKTKYRIEPRSDYKLSLLYCFNKSTWKINDSLNLLINYSKLSTIKKGIWSNSITGFISPQTVEKVFNNNFYCVTTNLINFGKTTIQKWWPKLKNLTENNQNINWYRNQKYWC